MTRIDRATAQSQADTIKNENTANQNTALRVGGLFRDLADSVAFEAAGVSTAGSAAANTAAINAAITAANAAGGGKVSLPRGTFACNPLTFKSNVTLSGEGDATVLDFSAVTGEADGISATGTIGTGVSLVTDAAEGDTDLDVPSTGFADGDWVMVYSDAVTGSTSIPKGEICRIATASTMTLVDPLQDSYATADNAAVAKITFVENVRFENFKIIGPTDDSSIFAGIVCDRVLNASFRGITTEKCWYTGIELKDACLYSVQDCYFNESGNSGLNYGVAIVQASQDGTITNIRGQQLRHLVTTGGSSARNGIARRLMCSNSVASQCYQSGFDTHAGAEDIHFDNCSTLGSLNEGITFESASGSITNCNIRDAGSKCISIRTNSVKSLNVRVLGNHVHGKRGAAERTGILLEVNTGYESFECVDISHNTVEDCEWGLSVINAETGRVTGMRVAHNTFARCGATGTDSAVFISHADGLICEGNRVDQNVVGVDGITLSDVTNSTLRGNIVSLPATGTCRCLRLLTTCSHVTIGGNVCSGGASSIGIELSDTSTNITIGSDNDLQGCATELSRGAGAGHRISRYEIESNINTADDLNLPDITFPRHRLVRVSVASGSWSDASDAVSLPSTPSVGELVTVMADGDASVAGDNIPIDSADTIRGNTLINTAYGSRTYLAVTATVWQLVAST